MIRRAVLVAALLLAGCESAPPSQSGSSSTVSSSADARISANPEKYARDRDLCRGQIDEYMKTRRNIDDSRREVFRGDEDRYGRSALPDAMENYGDSRRSDRLVASCMESRGWPQPQKSWWQKIGS